MMFDAAQPSGAAAREPLMQASEGHGSQTRMLAVSRSGGTMRNGCQAEMFTVFQDTDFNNPVLNTNETSLYCHVCVTT